MISLFGKLKQIKPMKTGTKVIFWTEDVPEELDRLQFTGEEGNLVFAPDKVKDAVIKAIEDHRPGVHDDKKQTGSQRLRGLIFQAFIKKYPQHIGLSTKESKDAWARAYDAAMEIHIEEWKSKISKLPQNS